MHTGKPLFKGADQHDQLRRITLVLGMFPQHFIEQTPSMYRREYFDEARVVEGDKVIHQYRLKDCKSYGSGQKVSRLENETSKWLKRLCIGTAMRSFAGRNPRCGYWRAGGAKAR